MDVRRPQCRHNAFRRVLGTRAAAHLVVCDLRRQRARPPPGGRVAHPHGFCDLKSQLTSSPFGFHGPRRAETRVDARTDRSERPLPGRSTRAPAGGQHPRDIVARRGCAGRISAAQRVRRPIESRLCPARPVATRRRTAAPTVTPTEGAPRRIRSDMRDIRSPAGIGPSRSQLLGVSCLVKGLNVYAE